MAWGNTYASSTNPIFILQKKLVRLLMTFSDYNVHTNPLFISLGIVKFNDLIFYHNALFMFDYHTGSLPDTFL